MIILGETLGVEFAWQPHAINGFSLRLTNSDTGEQLYYKQMIGYTLYEAVIKACNIVWADEMAEHDEYVLPERIAQVLGIEPRSMDDAECIDCDKVQHYEDMISVPVSDYVEEYRCTECEEKQNANI